MIVVDTHDADIDVLLEHDVLICTSSFLKARYLDRIKLEGFLAVASAYGIRVANTMFPNQSYQRIHLPLHSEIFQDREKMFPVIIIDEAHDAKNAGLLLSQAIRNLPYHHAFLLTATPVYNSWNDLGGILLLLPRTPFESFEYFRRAFRIPPSDLNEVGRKGPQEPLFTVLIELLSGVILARPESVSNFVEYEHHS